LYPSDKRFKSDFTEKTFPTKQSNKKARYLLARLEEYNSSNSAVDESKLKKQQVSFYLFIPWQIFPKLFFRID
jgi:hypothetical protein